MDEKVNQLLELIDFPLKLVNNCQKKTQTISDSNNWLRILPRILLGSTSVEKIGKKQDWANREVSLVQEASASSSDLFFCLGPNWLVFCTPALISQPWDAYDLAKQLSTGEAIPEGTDRSTLC